MVFVSACSSRKAGEAFLEAGAKHVVCVETLSEIEDRVQSNEMQNFVTDNVKRLEWGLQQSIDRKIQNLYAEIHAVTELSSRIDGKTMSW